MLCTPARRSAGRLINLATVLMLLAGCGSTPLETEAPPAFDLNGDWLLVPELSDPPPMIRALRARGVDMAFATQDFPVLTATRLTVEQNRDSMGVRYDGSDYRDVSWGTRQRGLWEVDAGWQDGVLVILSEAHDAKASERFSLKDGGGTLVVEVMVESGREKLISTRTFTRP